VALPAATLRAAPAEQQHIMMICDSKAANVSY